MFIACIKYLLTREYHVHMSPDTSTYGNKQEYACVAHGIKVQYMKIFLKYNKSEK